eukprot:239409-Rhodomonas_salina.1
MDRRFPDATPSQLASVDDNCSICREAMSTAKVPRCQPPLRHRGRYGYAFCYVALYPAMSTAKVDRYGYELPHPAMHPALRCPVSHTASAHPSTHTHTHTHTHTRGSCPSTSVHSHAHRFRPYRSCRADTSSI